jgi:hypothetical protein
VGAGLLWVVLAVGVVIAVVVVVGILGRPDDGSF